MIVANFISERPKQLRERDKIYLQLISDWNSHPKNVQYGREAKLVINTLNWEETYIIHVTVNTSIPILCMEIEGKEFERVFTDLWIWFYTEENKFEEVE